MSNEELILAELKALREEVQELRNAGKPLADLKTTLEPVVHHLTKEVVDHRF